MIINPMDSLSIYTHLLVGGDWNMNVIFPYIGNNHPNWLIFFRGVETNENMGLSENVGYIPNEIAI